MQNLINYQNFLSTQDPRFYIFFLFITIWSVIWKGFALWKAGRNNSPIWFIILLIVNTAGILEMIYLFAIKNKEAASENTIPTPTQEAKTETKVETVVEEKKEEITTPVAEVSDSAKSYVETQKSEEIHHEEIKTTEAVKTEEVKTEEVKQTINQ